MSRIFSLHQFGQLLLIVLAMCAIVLLALVPQPVASQGAGTPLTGYAWSDTIGWIDLTCQNTSGSSCGTWGIYVSDTGALSGYAWSENVGWVSANPSDLTGCPTAPCTATLSTTALSGWLRVISGSTAQSGSWDGFISLSGVGYGVQYSAGNFNACSNGTSCAWGDKNVGWVDFSKAHSLYNTCSATAGTVYTCANPDTGGIYRRIVRTDTNISCQQTVTNTDCTPPQYCSPGSPVCLWPPVDGNPTGSLSGHLQVRPNLVAKNATTTVYWSINNVSSCTVTGTDSTSWSGPTSATSTCSSKYASGCTSQPINKQTTYTLTCTALDSSTYRETATVNNLPDYQEK